jgi:predicted acyl esterase
VRIPYRSRLDGPQLAGWTPRGKRVEHRVLFELDVGVPMPDGVVLRGDLYRPDTAEPSPALLGWSPYNKDLMPTGLPAPFNEPGAVGYLASRGYAVLVAGTRGTGRSGGVLEPVMHSEGERADLCSTIAWLAEQDWCDGRVGMTSMSYFAISQLVAAGLRPPALRAIFPFGATTDWYAHGATQGGTLHSGFLGRYTAINGAAQRIRLSPAVRHALGYILGAAPAQRLIRRLMAVAIPRLPRMLPAPEPWMRRWAEYALSGERHEEASAWPTLEDIDIPVLIGSEWSMVGLHLFGAFEAWHRISAPKKMFIGPRWADWPWLRYQEELLAFYDHTLRGADNGYDELPPVRYWLHGAERWETSSDWPVPDTREWTLRLDGTRLGAVAGDDERTWAAIPVGMEYPGAFDTFDSQVIGYDTDPMVENVHLVGPVELTLPLRSTALDTHVQARLSDVDEQGRAQVLSVGCLAASHRAVDAERSTATETVHDHGSPTALTPGEQVRLRISLTPFAQLLRRGHRLRLELGSDPRTLTAPPEQGFVYFEVAGPPYPARNTVSHPDATLRLSVRGEPPW